MDKLLSDEELRDAINQLWDNTTKEGHVQSCGEYQHTVDKTLDLFNTQKRLYAESVIGQHNATYNNEMGINDASAGAISIAVDDTIRAIKSNPSNENQIRYTKWLTEEAIKYVSKGVAAKAQHDLRAEQKARINL